MAYSPLKPTEGLNGPPEYFGALEILGQPVFWGSQYFGALEIWGTLQQAQCSASRNYPTQANGRLEWATLSNFGIGNERFSVASRPTFPLDGQPYVSE